MSDAKPKAPPIKAVDIKAAMRKTWAAPEYAILWEVAPATGYGHKPRYADAMIMSLWPSRGLELHGVEVKVSRSDWMREAKDPTKAEDMAAFCDRWWLHVAPGVIHDLAEVPMAWGVREWNGKRWSTLREAAKTDAKPCDRKFLASLLRRAAEGVEPLAKDMAVSMLADERAQIEAEVERRVADRAGRRTECEAIVAALQEELGVTFTTNEYSLKRDDLNVREAGALLKVLMGSGVLTGWRSLGHMLAQLGTTIDSLIAVHDEALAHTKASIGPYAEVIEAAKERGKSKRKAGRADYL